MVNQKENIPKTNGPAIKKQSNKTKKRGGAVMQTVHFADNLPKRKKVIILAFIHAF